MTTTELVRVGCLLALAVPGFAKGDPAQSVSVSFQPLGEDVAKGVRPEKCLEVLREAFTKKGWRVVTPADGDPKAEEAGVRAEVRDCVVYVRSKAKSKVKQQGGDIPGPQPGHKIIQGGAHANGSEQEYGAAMEEERYVLLVVRLSVGDRFADVSSDAADQRLGQAAKSVAKGASAWLVDVKPR